MIAIDRQCAPCDINLHYPVQMTEPPPAAQPATPAQRPPIRILDLPVLRRAPWLVYMFFCLVAIGIAVMCIRLRLGDDLTASVCAGLTCGLIVCTAVCLWLSLRAQLQPPPKRKRKKVTVCLKAHSFGENEEGGGCPDGDAMCPICLTELEVGEKVVTLDCGHLFHVDCICNWTKRVAICPACRFNLPTVVASTSTSASVSPALPEVVSPV